MMLQAQSALNKEIQNSFGVEIFNLQITLKMCPGLQFLTF